MLMFATNLQFCTRPSKPGHEIFTNLGKKSVKVHEETFQVPIPSTHDANHPIMIAEHTNSITIASTQDDHMKTDLYNNNNKKG